MEIIARIEEQLPLHIDEYTDRNEWQGQDGRQHLRRQPKLRRCGEKAKEKSLFLFLIRFFALSLQHQELH